jgi:protein-L-isoaspartate(D-aspartate) O-methyltransferase
MIFDSELEFFRTLRERMVAHQLRNRGIRDPHVLFAMGKVPRHEFVPPQFRSQAYEDHPIPIAEGQTISQPYIVAIMLQDLALQPTDVVLEVGTGSGYVAALLGEIATRVFTIERHEVLARTAEAVLSRLGYNNVRVVVGDGTAGLPADAPFDAILVSAAAPSIPEPLFAQLAEGGRMIIPVGGPDVQELQLVRKQDGRRIVSNLEGCRFVPLIGGG